MIEILAETASTNADLIARLSDAAFLSPREGAWLVADRQTGGRGRLGRAWSDGAGNFMGSTVVHLRDGDLHAPSLALVAGIAVAETVAPYVPPPARALLKWPNDVMIAGAKLAGILLEGVGRAVVVGIGVNLAAAPEIAGRDTTALNRFGPAPSRDDFAAALALRFAAELYRWRHDGMTALIARWQALAHPPGTPLTVTQPGMAAISGQFAGLDVDGALRLALADGTTQTIHAGDVTFG